MGLFGRPDARDAFISQLRAELADLRSFSQREREQFAKEKAELLQAIMALSNPLALREMKRASSGDPAAPATTLPYKSTYYPRSEHLVYPPYPPARLSDPPTVSPKESEEKA